MCEQYAALSREEFEQIAHIDPRRFDAAIAAGFIVPVRYLGNTPLFDVLDVCRYFGSVYWGAPKPTRPRVVTA